MADKSASVRVAYWDCFPPASVTPSGDRIEPVFSWNKDHSALVQVGERDVQAEHDAAAVGVTPYEVIDRCIKTGDLLNLSDPGLSVDLSAAPESLADVAALLKQGEVATPVASASPSSAVASNPAPAGEVSK